MPLNFKFQKIDVLIGLLLTGIFILGFFVSYEMLILSKKTNREPSSETKFARATPAPLNENTPEEGVYNILFLGYGGVGHAGSLLTDSIIVVHVNTNTRKVSFISVPRDLWVNGDHKINAVSVTGFQNAGPVVQSVTGLPINYYVAVDFSGLIKIIDNLGKINVEVPKTFSDPYFPIAGEENNTCGKTEAEINELKVKYSGYSLETQFICRYEQLHFDKGLVILDGATALKFVRSRHGDSDFGRSERQVAVLTGIGQKLISFQTAGKLDGVIDSFSKIVKTDLTIGAIKSLLQAFGDPTAYNTRGVHLTTDNLLNEGKSQTGEYILYPKAGTLNFGDIQNFIKADIGD